LTGENNFRSIHPDVRKTNPADDRRCRTETCCLAFYCAPAGFLNDLTINLFSETRWNLRRDFIFPRRETRVAEKNKNWK